MKDFVVKNLVAQDVESELEKIGFDIAYRAKASDKYRYKTLKIFNLTIPQANILKQTALSLGADCAVHREVLTANVDKTDVILGGSYSQLRKIADKLNFQPFALKKLADIILDQLVLRKRNTKLVGILNITPDSFSDGGLFFEPKQACERFYKLIEDGADMIDIGAESTKPFSVPVSAEEQIERLKPLVKEFSNSSVPISIDTTSSIVANFALDYGVKIINDISGGNFDSKMFDTVSRYNAGIIIQHSTKKSEERPLYNDVVEEVYLDLLHKQNLAKECGIKNIILDVGIGFGKSKEENFELLNRIEEFYSLEAPLMVGVSRKSLLGINSENNDLKDSLSAAISYPLIQNGVDYLRVHNVKLHKQLVGLAI